MSLIYTQSLPMSLITHNHEILSKYLTHMVRYGFYGLLTHKIIKWHFQSILPLVIILHTTIKWHFQCTLSWSLTDAQSLNDIFNVP